MKNKLLTLNVTLVLTLWLTGLQAQQAIPAAGGNASGSGGSVSYSVGQVVYTTITGTTGSVAQGVLQPYEISVISGIEEAAEIILQCEVFPNPVTDVLWLTVKNFNLPAISFQMYDMNGKLLKNGKIVSDKTSFETGNLTPATYYLKISTENKEVKIFKIVKN
ncbi:MAG: T9SS type A sorting domain-containing protein [Bacteroidales bacterium]|nr:T9SS type A sorting domain-containing protein [Bacteroidales bacterium]